jgi:hypothetical protein
MTFVDTNYFVRIFVPDDEQHGVPPDIIAKNSGLPLDTLKTLVN